MITSKTLFAFYLTVVVSAHCLGLNPSKTYKTTPDDHQMNFEEISIPTSDGAALTAWYFPTQNGDQLMVMSHDGVGNMADFIGRVRILVNYGFNVLCYDYRGYGTSSDFNVDRLQYIYQEFFTDFDAVVKYSSERFNHEIIAYGWGIGGGISIVRGYKNSHIAGIIADDPFVDLIRLKAKFREIQAVMKIPDEIMNSKYNPYDVVSGEPSMGLRGMLFFHGNKNILFTYDEMNRLLDATNLVNKELYSFKVSQRMDNFHINESEYTKRIYAFVMNL